MACSNIKNFFLIFNDYFDLANYCQDLTLGQTLATERVGPLV